VNHCVLLGTLKCHELQLCCDHHDQVVRMQNLERNLLLSIVVFLTLQVIVPHLQQQQEALLNGFQFRIKS